MFESAAKLSSFQTTYTLSPDTEICGFSDKPSLILRLITSSNVEPLSELFTYRISPLPKVVSFQVIWTSVPDAESCGVTEEPKLLLRFFVGPKETASSRNFLHLM
jgi:hypothetical protein